MSLLGKYDSPFLSGPIKSDGLIVCCKCDPDIQRPHKGEIPRKINPEYWCLRCGHILSNKDIDIYVTKLRENVF